MNTHVNSVNGSIPIAALGKTLMHEHLLIGLPGWEGDTLLTHRTRAELVARCVDLVQELQANGFRTLLDPCPNDLGRDLDLMGEVASRTGFQILFAVGLYDEFLAGPYWRAKAARDPDAVGYLTDMYVREIERGVADGGCKPAVIKVATGPRPFSPFESVALRAAAQASAATGVPITTHTAGVDGDHQLQILKAHGLASHRVVVGHCCGSNDPDYHQSICKLGGYIGFDRFGLPQFNSDENRITGLVNLLAKGYAEHVIISHDCVFNMRGALIGREDVPPIMTPMHFSRTIVPQLVSRGVAQDAVEALLTDNPRRYFAAAPPRRVAPPPTTANRPQSSGSAR